jgi:hypothetical protein
MSFYSNELQMGNFQAEKLVEYLILNLSHSIIMYHNTKPLKENLQTLEKLSCTNLKFHLKLATMAKNFL